jgi:hypothetical protein
VTDQVVALTAFCVNNPELDELEAMLAEFNLFEAAGLTREEIRHSRFLSFLLDPTGAHGLGELFVTRLLQAAVHGRPPDEVGVTALDLELMDLGDLQVACEVLRIDILMLSESNRFAVVIENKVGASEHSNQLPRYFAAVEAMRPGWRLLPILLSPQGMEPTDQRYFSVSYENIVSILGSLLESRKTVLGPDVHLAISHYERLLRRHIVSDSRLTELCQQIISKHRKALDLLIEHMDDPKARLWRLIDPMLEEANFVRTERRWLPAEWLEWMPKSEQSGTGYIAGFWADVYGKRVRLILELQPGSEAARRALFEAAQSSPLFRVKRREMSGQWSRIFDLELSPTREPNGDEDEWATAMADRMRSFASSTLPELTEVLRKAVESP